MVLGCGKPEIEKIVGADRIWSWMEAQDINCKSPWMADVMDGHQVPTVDKSMLEASSVPSVHPRVNPAGRPGRGWTRSVGQSIVVVVVWQRCVYVCTCLECLEDLFGIH